MKHVTKLNIELTLNVGDDITEVVGELSEYCSSTFTEVSKNNWFGEFVVTCPTAPKLAEGDFVDDLSPYFPSFLKLKRLYDASFTLQIAVGKPAEDFFDLESYSVALLAALGASISILVHVQGVIEFSPN